MDWKIIAIAFLFLAIGYVIANYFPRKNMSKEAQLLAVEEARNSTINQLNGDWNCDKISIPEGFAIISKGNDAMVIPHSSCMRIGTNNVHINAGLDRDGAVTMKITLACHCT
jgi:hypothetical protein